MTWKAIVGGQLLVSLCAGLAVDFGFGAAFISDAVAFLITAYVAALSGFFIGRRRAESHWSQNGWVRAPIAALVSACVLLLLRGPLQVDIPWMDAGTTGHTPYAVFLITGLVALSLLEVAYRLAKRDPEAQK